jgi:hypothetical protein
MRTVPAIATGDGLDQMLQGQGRDNCRVVGLHSKLKETFLSAAYRPGDMREKRRRLMADLLREPAGGGAT